MTDPLTAFIDVFTPAAFVIFLVGNIFGLMKHGSDTPLPYSTLASLILPGLIATQIFFDEFLGGDLTIAGYVGTLLGIAILWFLAGGFLLSAPILGAVGRVGKACFAAGVTGARGIAWLARCAVYVVGTPIRLARGRASSRNRNENAGTVEAADYSNKSAATTPTTIADLEGDDDEDDGWSRPSISRPSLPSLPSLSSIRGNDDTGSGYHSGTRTTNTGRTATSTDSDEGRDWSAIVPSPSMPSLGGVGDGLRRRLTQRNRLPPVKRADETDS